MKVGEEPSTHCITFYFSVHLKNFKKRKLREILMVQKEKQFIIQQEV